MKLPIFSLLFCIVFGEFSHSSGSAKSPFDLELPPPEVNFAPVLKQLPESMPQYQTLAKQVIFDEDAMEDKGILFLGRKIRQTETIRVFASDGYIKSLGEMLEPEEETGLPMNFQYIFVKVKKGEAKMLDKLLIVRDRGPLARVYKDSNEIPMRGNLVQIKAEIQLTSLVNAGKGSGKEDDFNYDYYRARVLSAIGLSVRGDVLIKGRLQTTESTTQGPRNGITSDIIGGENEERSGLYGLGNFVFINKGSEDGVKVGDIIPLYINRSLRNSKTPIMESTLSQGLLKVVHADTGVATALVVQSETGIRQGDRTGALAKNVHSDESESSVEDFDLSE